MVDNYEDGNYHVYLAHSHLINCFYMDASHNDLFDNMTSMWGPNVPKPEWPASGLPGAEGYNIMESRTRGGKDQSYSMLYPNVFWNRYGIWHSVTNVTPTGVDSCLTTFDLFFKKETLADADFVAKCVSAEDHLQKEDIDLCLRVSENLRNPRYDAGRYAPIEVRLARMPAAASWVELSCFAARRPRCGSFTRSSTTASSAPRRASSTAPVAATATISRRLEAASSF